jgi:hypothetical protein
MARQQLHTSDVETEQLPPIFDDGSDDERLPEVILVDERMAKKEYLADLAFNEEPVTILIQPGAEENAPNYHLCSVNGKGAEVLLDRKWIEFKYLPVGQEVTTKRKYLEVLLRSKRNTVIAGYQLQDGKDPVNTTMRPTSAAMAVTIVEDRSPRGRAWASEMLRRNY